MPVYCGVDFHARQQTVSYCDMADGEIHLKELDHARDNLQALAFSAGSAGRARSGSHS